MDFQQISRKTHFSFVTSSVVILRRPRHCFVTQPASSRRLTITRPRTSPVAVVYRLRSSAIGRVLPLLAQRWQLRGQKRSISSVFNQERQQLDSDNLKELVSQFTRAHNDSQAKQIVACPTKMSTARSSMSADDGVMIGPTSLKARLCAALTALRDPNIWMTMMSLVGSSTVTMGSGANHNLREQSSTELYPPLTTVELHNVLTRRLSNLQLPDDNHTLLAESLMNTIKTVSSLLAKLYLLNLQPVQLIPTHWPRLTRLLQILTLSQLQPFQVLQAPLLRLIRPLQWLLVPFAAMATPLALHLTIQYTLSWLCPSPHSFTNISSRRPVCSNSACFVQAIINALKLLRDLVNGRARSAPARSAPHFSTSLVSKPSSQLRHYQQSLRQKGEKPTDKEFASHAETISTKGIIYENTQSVNAESGKRKCEQDQKRKPTSESFSSNVIGKSRNHVSSSEAIGREAKSQIDSDMNADYSWKIISSSNAESVSSNNVNERVVRFKFKGLTSGAPENGKHFRGLASFEDDEQQSQQGISRSEM